MPSGFLTWFQSLPLETLSEEEKEMCQRYANLAWTEKDRIMLDELKQYGELVNGIYDDIFS